MKSEERKSSRPLLGGISLLSLLVLLAGSYSAGCSRDPGAAAPEADQPVGSSGTAGPALKMQKRAPQPSKLFDQAMAKIERLNEQKGNQRDAGQYLAAVQQILHEAESLLQTNGLSDQQRAAARKVWFEAAFDLAQVRGSEARPLLPKLEKLYREAKQQWLSEEEAAEIDQYRIWVNFIVKRESAASGQAVHKELLQMVDQFLADHDGHPAGVELLMAVGRSAEMSGAYAVAKAAHEMLLRRYPTDPATTLARSQLSTLKLVGQPLELSGPTLDGKQFNIEQWRGKLVLVDFWATWCAPCIMEMPHLIEVYKRYHDKGLEIVGVSLDHSREQLEQFVKQRQIRWQQVFYEPDAEDPEWQNPLAAKYNITSIPMTLLVDREGKVARVGLRGEHIERAVRELLTGSATESQPWVE